MPVVVRKSLSQAPFWTTLVSPVTISTPASAAAPAIEPAICRMQVDGHAFFDDRRAGKVERPRPADRQIVDRAADGKLADIATGEDTAGRPRRNRW